MRVTNEAGERRYAASYSFGVDPQHRFLLKAWIRAGQEAQSRIILVMYDENGNWLGDKWRRVDIGPDWRHYGFVLTDLKPDTARLAISLSADSGNKEGGTVWFDDVSYVAREDVFSQETISPDPETWTAFPLDWRDSGETATDMSFLLDGP